MTEKRGAGRPQIAEEKIKQPLGIRVRPAVKTRLEDLSKESGYSQAAILEHLIQSCKKLPENLKKI